MEEIVAVALGYLAGSIPFAFLLARRRGVDLRVAGSGNVGAANIREFQETEIIIAPSIKTEGKLFQTVQSVGMGTR